MSFTQQTNQGVVFHTADTFSAAGGIAHGFATRIGGVSKPPFDQLNLGMTRRDDPQDVLENYPPQVIRLLMNHIGTHDTERAMTVLGGITGEGHDREWQEKQRLTPEGYRQARQLLCLASLMQFTLPGIPCIYYGDEAGMQGCKDPFNRGFYPWGEEDVGLVQWYRQLGEFRRSVPVFKEGGLRVLHALDDLVVYTRTDSEGRDAVLIAINRGENVARATVEADFSKARFFSGIPVTANVKLPAHGYSIMLLQPVETPDGPQAKNSAKTF